MKIGNLDLLLLAEIKHCNKTMTKNLKEALQQMLFMSDEQVLSDDFKKINFKKKDWFLKYHWTEKREQEFIKWLSNYLKNNWEGIVAYKATTKRLRDKMAEQFVLQYGCKTRELTNQDFMAIVSWEHLKEVMSERELKAFYKWMEGQTTSTHGVYRSDLSLYLAHLPNTD